MVIYGFCGTYRFILGCLHIYIYIYRFIGLIVLYRVILLGPSLQFVSHCLHRCVHVCRCMQYGISAPTFIKVWDIPKRRTGTCPGMCRPQMWAVRVRIRFRVLF